VCETSNLHSMTLSNWKDIIQQDNVADRKSWMGSTMTMRYCPLCLTQHNIPYPRLSWRLLFLPLYIEHNVVLQTGCWNRKCDHFQQLSEFSQKGRCIKCNVQLDEAPIAQPKNCDRLIRFSASIKEILEHKSLLHITDIPYDTKEFFAVLLLLVRYFNQYLPREISWEGLGENYRLSLNSPYNWRKNNNVACILLEKSLVLENWTSCKDFFNQNRSRFKRLCYEYDTKTPVTIKRLIEKNDVYSYNTRFKQRIIRESFNSA
jgi:hypothetical protein